MSKKQKRLILVAGLAVFAAGAVALVLSALKGSISYFYTPSEIAALDHRPANAIRLGGLVADGSVAYTAGNSVAREALVSFTVTDGNSDIAVTFEGILPDLFREGQGVIVLGRLSEDGRSLAADNVLAKHDENYMPKEVADALKEQGRWQEDTAN